MKKNLFALLLTFGSFNIFGLSPLQLPEGGHIEIQHRTIQKMLIRMEPGIMEMKMGRLLKAGGEEYRFPGDAELRLFAQQQTRYTITMDIIVGVCSYWQIMCAMKLRSVQTRLVQGDKDVQHVNFSLLCGYAGWLFTI